MASQQRSSQFRFRSLSPDFASNFYCFLFHFCTTPPSASPPRVSLTVTMLSSHSSAAAWCFTHAAGTSRDVATMSPVRNSILELHLYHTTASQRPPLYLPTDRVCQSGWWGVQVGAPLNGQQPHAGTRYHPSAQPPSERETFFCWSSHLRNKSRSKLTIAGGERDMYTQHHLPFQCARRATTHGWS